MSNSRKNMNNDVSPPPGQFQQLMDELDIRPKSPEEQKRYHRAALTKFLLPRAIAAALAALVVVLIVLLLAMPAEFREVTTAEASQFGARVEFRLNRALMGSVSASLDGRPLFVIKDGGKYHVQVEQNGELTLTAETLLGRTVTRSVTIASVDETAPHVVKSQVLGSDIYIYLEDEGGSGVDWAEISAASAETGADFPPVGYDEAEGFVRFPIPGESVRVLVPDKRGNQLSLLMDPVSD